MEYGVQVDNKFAFGSDDELGDPSELLKLGVQEKKTPAQKKAEREEARKAKAKEEANRKAAAAAVAPASKEARPVASGERGGRGGQRGRGGPRPPRGDGPRPPRPERPPREEGEAKDGFHEIHGRGRGRGAPRGDRPPYRGGRGGGPRPPPTNDWPNADEAPKEVTDENTPPAFEGQRAFRGRGGFGGRGGRGGFRPPRGAREFDRQSGSDRTGVRAQEKKEGHGKGNWGTEKDELAGETEEVKAEELETPPVPREKTAEELEQERLEAEIAAQKTLAEYKASLQKDEKKFNIRKANEGNQDSFGKLVPLAKKELPEDETHEVVIVQGKETKKKLVDLDIRFADAGRDQGHRGGSDRPRGRGRGGNRGGFGGAGRGGAGGGAGAARGGAGTGGGARRSDSYFKADLGNATEFPTLG